MSKRVSIKLTKDQMNQIKKATGKDANQLDFSVEELEERIAPSTLRPRFE